MRDTVYDGRPFRTLNVIDEGNREALRIEVGTSIPAALVVRVLDQLLEVYRRASGHLDRQRPRAYRQRLYRLGRSQRGKANVYPAGQAQPERVHQATQPQPPRRGAQRPPIQFDLRSPTDRRGMGDRLQRLPPPHIPVEHLTTAVRQAIYCFPERQKSLCLDCPVYGRRSRKNNAGKFNKRIKYS